MRRSEAELPQKVSSSKGVAMTEPNAAGTTSGLSDYAAGALAYVTIIPAIVFLLVEPYNKKPFVRFHAWQCIFLYVACIVVEIVLGMIPIVGWIILPFFGLGVLVLVIFLIIKASQGQKLVLPVIGPFAEKQAGA
jgi:uncharacterized membrane protein